MVERAQLADHRQNGVGIAVIVERGVREVLDLAHDVVAEVADEPAVQRGKVVEHRRPVGGEQRLDGGQHPSPCHWAATSGGSTRPPRTETWPSRPTSVRQGTAPHEGVAAPAFAPLHRLEQEAGLVPHRLEEGARPE